jgi:O-antigen ligase
VGRAGHEIFGAGGLAAGAFAGLALWPQARNRLVQGAGIVLILFAVVLTQSRGPILAFGSATLAATAVGAMKGTRARWVSLLGVGICFAIPVAMILTEPWIKSLLCSGEGGFCRPSARQDVWFASAALVADEPWFGVGPGFRFAAGTVPHPHNGLLGLMVFFGLPIAMLFISIVALAVTRAAAAAVGPARHFALTGAFFSAGFLGTDLANPFGYLNTHYLYLWLPLMMGACLAGSLIGTAEPRPLRRPSGPSALAASLFARSSQRG